ncbi:TIGR00725 family protein [Polyangium aurulentum]|uniref:TIGR00725 family protein n=1 Tax=Polyangium aurulentum TaxID=2567896 RepID=UPI0010AE1ABC|nr:TIGR00725 family protein [Polyangium aurulentum]UQA58611.1 TIGR00725 family protein [Polyangium aurulentum]
MNEATSHPTRRRFVLAAVGYASPLAPPLDALCVDLGRRAVEAGFRVVTGGLGGVMEAVSRGARSAPSWREGDVVGIIPGYDRRAANPHLDIVVPTGMQIGRNILIVAMADVVVAVGGGAGTLSEIAVAWQLEKPIVTLAAAGGWAERLAGETIDARRSEPLRGAANAEEAIAIALELAARGVREPGDIGSGSRRGE